MRARRVRALERRLVSMPAIRTDLPAPDLRRDGGVLRYADRHGLQHGPPLLDAEEAQDFAAFLADVHGTTPAHEPAATLTRLLAVFRRGRA